MVVPHVRKKNIWLEHNVRLDEPLAAQVRELAHAARLPRGEFLRAVIAAAVKAGRYPPAAPLALVGNGPAANAALAILAPLVSNLTQLDARARQAGGPLAGEQFLAGLAGWAGQARELAAALRSGLLDEAAAQLVVDQLATPGADANALAHRLNGGEVVAAPEWGAALKPLNEAFARLAAGGPG